MKEKIICLSFILLVFLFGIMINTFYNNTNNKTYIKITIKGAVRHAGVYFCEYGSSFAKLIEIAGGITERGYLPEGLDYNMPITNDITINIPTKYYSIKKNTEGR
ncbi:SLBB domain-containing protein [Brachyspira pilosicoli]|uniref:SLBB domain-containing protein n=1 Tax=Brachyspira pilosicoli TaxID=52584 RepID=UPI0030079CDD